MANDAKTGHGAIIAMETDPTTAPYVFDAIGQLRGTITTKSSLNSTESTPHNAAIDEYVPDGRILRDPITITVNMLYGNPAMYHRKLKDFFYSKQYFRIRVRGPEGVPNDDEEIYYGFLESVQVNNAERSGAREGIFVFRPSGPMTVDGVVYG